jgi:hypothetical protein
VIDYEGTIVDPSGAAAPGVQLLFTRLDGVELKRDTIRAVTGSDGHFFIREEARSQGTLQARVEVIPPDRPSFRADSVPLEATRSGGTKFFGRWITHPFVAYLVQLRYRANSNPVSGATVDFYRTGSQAIDPDHRRVQANGDGLFWIMGDVSGSEPVIGRLEVRPPRTNVVLRKAGIRLPLLHAFGESRFDVMWVGSSIAYTGRLLWADSGEPAANVDVEFARTDGLEVTADSFTVKTDTSGLFRFDTHLADPVSEGEVVGMMNVSSPAPYQPLAVEVRLPTFDADTTRLLGEWTIQRAP